KATPARDRRWCGREGLVHHRFRYLHGKGTVGNEGGEGECWWWKVVAYEREESLLSKGEEKCFQSTYSPSEVQGLSSSTSQRVKVKGLRVRLD
ncbi:hypothetical protein A2U01_0067194, partial [Trifolium medium]|nr:hypothetical protein [Trifolium medium]